MPTLPPNLGIFGFIGGFKIGSVVAVYGAIRKGARFTTRTCSTIRASSSSLEIGLSLDPDSLFGTIT
jgi:hypothetical protein